ncbi:4'-phosphopantetheinyl transferase superfamily protein [Streptomyces sp. S.PNR 29]|uniref:4'-phosphopantetheinyl transferase family protein n=1 Tax=Streptomyces sp. S.PNR 29 TaxID=2973805 RepID=UPI0025AF4EE5|nr:4'-phosphopantetheinyl transferase superfamily protein [Streptomyces sp. S.PNR 29]MDN0197930.1 4'-phosphopantetheinyl transferase superfamily protein [Streptomyces sp. S.PNR 29]
MLPEPSAAAGLCQVTPQGPWHTVRRELAERGSVVVFAHLQDWLADFQPDTGAHSALPALLGRDFARLQKMTNDEVRARFLASRLLLKYTAGAVLEARPADIDLAYKPGGRPYLRGCDQVDISLSHTADLLVVGITRCGWIGVDAELSSRQLHGSAVERQICTPYETDLLARMAPGRRNAALVRLWTLKEAYSKAIGQGLRFRFTEFGFAPGAQRVQVLRPDGTPGSGDEWSFRTWTVAGQYTVSVALVDLGFDDAVDVTAQTMLDEGMVDALLSQAR